MTRRRPLTAALFTAVAALSLSVSPPATAVTPPPIDNTLLPPPGPAAPPEPTEQHEQCSESTPNRGDPPASTQLESLDLPTVRALSRGRGQTVAVIDTGVARHRLLPRLVPGGDYVSTGDGTDDCDGHGTVVAGIVAATGNDEGSAFSGVAPEATILSIRQSSNKFRPADRPGGSGFGNVETLAMAIRTAADLGATVINVSSVACLAVADALDDRALGAALAYAVDVKNVVVVAAAGNVGGPGQCPGQNPPADPEQPGRPDWDSVEVVVSPAWYDDFVLTVGSVDSEGAPSEFTLAGPWVDVAANGEQVVSLDPDGEGLVDTLPRSDDAAPISGTSYAAPVVAGIAALVRSRSPQLTARQVMQRIEHTAHQPSTGWNPLVGYGVVDALAAVSGAPATALPTRPEPDRSVPDRTPSAGDSRPGRFAFAGAAVCVAVTATCLTSSRLRRRDTVAND